MDKEIQTLKENHNRYVRLLKEEIEKERNAKLEWKEKYTKIRDGARALSEHSAIIHHLEAHIREQDAIIEKYQKAHAPVVESLILSAIEHGSLK